jgi:subtilisin-like proprotein convertase family protein
MKLHNKLFLPLLLLFTLGSARAQYYEVIETDGFDDPSLWNEEHRDSSVYNKWVIGSCNAITGNTATVKYAQAPAMCYFDYRLKGKSIIYRKFNAKCFEDLWLTFDWKCGSKNKARAAGSVIFSLDGINWTTVTRWNFDDGLFYNSPNTVRGGVDLSRFYPSLDNNEFYIGFQFEIYPDPLLGYVPVTINQYGSTVTSPNYEPIEAPAFTIDNVVLEGRRSKPEVNAGSDISACPVEVFLNGTGPQYLGRSSWRSNDNTYAIPGIIPGAVTTSEINNRNLHSLVKASDVTYVRISITHTTNRDLELILEAPDGSSIYLSRNNGPMVNYGAGYENIAFSADAALSVTETGSYTYTPVRPEEPFSKLTGPAEGIWKLKVLNEGVVSGRINSWTLLFRDRTYFSWTPAGGLSSPDALSTSANVNQTTVYTLTATNVKGCSSSDDVTVTIYTAPVLSGPPATVTAQKGQDAVIAVQLTDQAIGDETYSWEYREKNSQTWVPLSDNASYSGTSTPVLTVHAVTQAMDRSQYRVIAGRCGSLYTTSGVSTLNVSSRQGQRRGLTASSAEENTPFSVYPNPVKDRLFITYTSGSDQLANVEIFNVLGEKVRNLSCNVSSGKNSIAADLTGLEPGVYTVRIDSIISRVVKE